MMRIAIFILSLAFTMAGCATLSDDANLYEVYRSYTDSVSVNNVKDKAPDYLTSRMLSAMNLENHLVTGEFVVFDRYFEREVNHFESIKGDVGCLSVNGFNKNEEPITLNIEYHHTDGWRIDYVHVDLKESPSDFQRKISCPLDRF